MKVALILTGHLRCWEKVFRNTKNHIIDKYDTDVFIHTWEREAYWDPHSSKGVTENGPKLNVNDVCDAYKPIHIQVDNFEDYEYDFQNRAKKYENFYHVPKNQISMWYKVGAGVEQMEHHMLQTGKVYDMVVRMRPDLVFNENLPQFDPNKFYTLGYRNHVGQGTSDMIQVGNFFTVGLFGKLLIHLPFLYKETGLLCPHVISKHFIERLQLPWQEFMINKTIMHTPIGEYKHKSMYQ
jgi:hypothetical protein